VSNPKREWTYFNEAEDKWVEPPIIRDELDALFHEGKIDDYTECVNVRTAPRHGPMQQMPGIFYSNLSKVDIEFAPEPNEFLAARKDKPTTVLSGPNNGGKSFFLRHMYSHAGHEAYFVACNRFSHVDVLNSRQRDNNEHVQRYQDFISNFQSSRINSEDNELKLDQILTGIKDRQRVKMFNTARELLGNTFEMLRTDPENEFSPFIVNMDGENLRYGSSGTRLLLTILGILVDERFSIIIVDEP